MTKIHELRDLEHHLEKEAPLRREPETLSEHYDELIDDGLFSIKALSEMKSETQMQLCAQGIGPYQRGYMRRWAQFVLYGHEKKYHKLLAENEELRQELRKIKQVVEDLGAHLEERQH